MAPKEALVPCHRQSVRRAIVDDWLLWFTVLLC